MEPDRPSERGGDMETKDIWLTVRANVFEPISAREWNRTLVTITKADYCNNPTAQITPENQAKPMFNDIPFHSRQLSTTINFLGPLRSPPRQLGLGGVIVFIVSTIPGKAIVAP